MSESKNHQGESSRSRRLTLDDYLKVRLEDLSDDDLAKVRNHIILDLMSFLILLFLQQLHALAGEEFTNRIFHLMRIDENVKNRSIPQVDFHQNQFKKSQ